MLAADRRGRRHRRADRRSRQPRPNPRQGWRPGDRRRRSRTRAEGETRTDSRRRRARRRRAPPRRCSRAARDADNDVRRESLRALASVGGAGEVTGLVALVVSRCRRTIAPKRRAASAAVLRRSDPSRASRTRSLHTHTPPTSKFAPRCCACWDRAAIPQRSPFSGRRSRTPNADVKRAAILALGEWPECDARSPTCSKPRARATNPAHQVLAVRGAIQLIGLPAPARAAPRIREAPGRRHGLAKQAAEKRAILALLPRYPVKESLDLATALVERSRGGRGSEGRRRASGTYRETLT